MGAGKTVQWVKHLLSQILPNSILRTNSAKESSNLHRQNTNTKYNLEKAIYKSVHYGILYIYSKDLTKFTYTGIET